MITFVDDVGVGDFYFKAFLTGDGTQQTKLSAVTVLFDTAGGGSSPDTVVVVEEDVEEEVALEEVLEEVVVEEIEEDVVPPTSTVDYQMFQSGINDLKVELNTKIDLLTQSIQDLRDDFENSGVSSATGFYLDEYIRFGNGANEPEAILKLKTFLNEYEGEGLDLEDLTYSQETFDAVLRFQEKYAADILTPWGLSSGTGFVGETTVKKINEIVTAAQ